jgi:beta-N-acetylhexosaminidase
MKPVSAAFVCIKGTELSTAEADFLHKFNPVGLTIFKRNIDNPSQLRKLTDDIRNAVGREDFLIAVDQEGGPVRRMRPPYWHNYIAQQQIATLPTKEAERLIYLQALLIANDLHNAGINVNFAPVADTFHDSTSYILKPRCFSDNPHITAEYAKILSETYMDNGICPCIKHLPGHGLAQTDPHIGLAKINETLDELKKDWEPFSLLSKTVPIGMTAHIIVSEIDTKPITQSSKGIQIIREDIGFTGLLLTDAIEMKSLKGPLETKVKLSLEAGCDVVCFCSGHNQNNPFIVEENTAVLTAAGYLSDKSMERLNLATQIIKNKTHQKENIENLKKEYDELVQKTTEIQTANRDATENWSDDPITNLTSKGFQI